MATTRVIEAKAVISAQDKTGGVLKAIGDRIRALGRTSTTTLARAGAMNAAQARASGMRPALAAISARQRMMRGVETGAGGLGGGMAGLGVGALPARVLGPAALAYGAGSALSNFAEAERRMTRIGNTVGATRDQMKEAMGDAQRIAFDTAQPFGKIVEGMETLAAQGRSLKEIQDVLPAVAKTAQASGSEVDDIAKTADAVGSHLGVTAGEMQKAFDLMADGGKRGSFELKDMARYLPSLLPAAKALGVQGTKGLTDIVALMQMVRKSSGTSEEAAASMSDIMQKMEIEETTKKFKKFGVDSTAAFAKARKEGKNVFDVLEDLLQQATKGDLSKLPQLFGDKEALRFARSLMLDAGRWRREAAEMTQTAPGTIGRDMNQVMGDTKARIDQLSAAFGSAARQLGALIAIPAAPALKEIAEAAERLRRALESGEAGKTVQQAIDEGANRWAGKEQFKLRQDVDARTTAIDEEIGKRQAGIDDMDAADKQPVTGMLGRGSGPSAGSGSRPGSGSFERSATSTARPTTE